MMLMPLLLITMLMMSVMMLIIAAIQIMQSSSLTYRGFEKELNPAEQHSLCYADLHCAMFPEWLQGFLKRRPDPSTSQWRDYHAGAVYSLGHINHPNVGT